MASPISAHEKYLVPVISALFPDGYAVKTTRGCQLHRVTRERNRSKTPSSLNNISISPAAHVEVQTPTAAPHLQMTLYCYYKCC